MKFMIIRKADAETEAGIMPTAELITAMTDYNERLVKAGILVDGDGLWPSAQGARIRFSNGTPTVVDGPFAEAKELIAGYTLIEVADRDEAVAWARQWPVEDGHGNVELEIRRIYVAEDFGGVFSLEMQQREARLREEAAANACK